MDLHSLNTISLSSELRFVVDRHPDGDTNMSFGPDYMIIFNVSSSRMNRMRILIIHDQAPENLRMNRL